MSGISHPLSTSQSAPIQYVTSARGNDLNTTTTVTITGIRPGDLVCAVGAAYRTTPPTYTAGWSLIQTQSNATVARSMAMVYKFANSTSETITFTSSGSSSGFAGSSAIAFRNARGIGAVGARNSSSTSNSFYIPQQGLPITLEATNNSSAVWLGGYVSIFNGSLVGGTTNVNGQLYRLNVPGPTFQGGANSSGSMYMIAGVVEILN